MDFSTSVQDTLWTFCKITQVKALTDDPEISTSDLNQVVSEKSDELEALNDAIEMDVE